MKITSILIAFVLFVSCASKQVANQNEISINSTSLTKVGNDYEMKITKIVSDSRCPEGVTCIWAGEVQLELKIYRNDKLEKTETLSINNKTVEQNKGFFAKYISTDKKIKDILIQPIKKEDQNIELKEYVLKLVLE
jgi:YbbR domain-containing protein